ncbi:MAG TPA: hypothetical protein PLQ56_03945 [Aggregatilineales bacterium]|nr:hypothetical protein [Aggregatilineales bacterium]
MSALAQVAVPKSVVQPDAGTNLRPIHVLLGIQSLVVILVSINRLSSLTQTYVAANEFLRWQDLINMLPLPLISAVASWLLLRLLEQRASIAARGRLTLSIVFMVGLYLLAASYGTHEVTNYLHVRFCPPEDFSRLCEIVTFNDDEFSHWVFFAGFVLMNVALLCMQVIAPHQRQLNRGDMLLLILNGLFIGLGVFANLAFEEIGLDLYVVALLAVLALGLLWRVGRQPLVIYYVTAYGVGLVGTLIYKGLVL